jgi:hypothetical protein
LVDDAASPPLFPQAAASPITITARWIIARTVPHPNDKPSIARCTSAGAVGCLRIAART